MALSAHLNHKKFKQEMEMRQLKQEKFAEQLGITDRHLRNLKKRDTDVASSVLYNISQAFHKPMEEFLPVGAEASEE